MPITERQRVQAHRSRARMVGTIATLCVEDWEQTVTDFNGFCAYCQKEPFTLLEHFLPVEIAGTSVNNCVPACMGCNKRKDNYHGDDLIARIGRDTFERIRIYLASRTATSIADNPTPRILASRNNPPDDAPYRTLDQTMKGLNISYTTLHYYVKRLSITVRRFMLDPRKYMSVDDVDRIKYQMEHTLRPSPRRSK